MSNLVDKLLSKAIPQEILVESVTELLNKDITENEGKLSDMTKKGVQALAAAIEVEHMTEEEILESAEPIERLMAMGTLMQLQNHLEEVAAE